MLYFVTDDFAIVIHRKFGRVIRINLQYVVRLVSVKPWESMPLHDSNVILAERICTHIHISLFSVFCLSAPHRDAPCIQSDPSFPPSWNINALSFVMQLHDATMASTRANDRFRRYTIAVHSVFLFFYVLLFFYHSCAEQ